MIDLLLFQWYPPSKLPVMEHLSERIHGHLILSNIKYQSLEFALMESDELKYIWVSLRPQALSWCSIALTHALDFDDTPIPSIDISQLLQSQKPFPLSPPDIKTISVNVFSINGNSCNAVAHDTDIFYDSELLAVVHRYRSTSSGFVSIQLWVWYGKKCIFGEKEECKVQELAKRYNAKQVSCC